jgi:hypothetical protein
MTDSVDTQATSTDSAEPQESLEIIPYIEEPRDPSKTGNRPKQLVALEVYGYQVGRGKNRRIVTPDDVYKLAAMGCTDREIANWFNTKDDTLRYNFAEILLKGREDLKMALRQAMLKNALGGNAVMQIWLSKNYLGFSDNPTNFEDNKPLPWNDE